ncbi:hypothetical protein BD289DRAFT_436638 [Coniella lustricola]|uniref:Uncharacterized protein n=1 Tax=Coniella lustricola TaxID=2025994 RepID=A0A2T3A4Z3_9PEZI|nr:hypothetical protein BD289DRAFT_436638 [Coniella lustricola]
MHTGSISRLQAQSGRASASQAKSLPASQPSTSPAWPSPALHQNLHVSSSEDWPTGLCTECFETVSCSPAPLSTAGPFTCSPTCSSCPTLVALWQPTRRFSRAPEATLPLFCYLAPPSLPWAAIFPQSSGPTRCTDSVLA